MKFIVAVDGSEQSESALRYAIDIARGTDSSITVIHSVMPEIYNEGGEILIEDMSEAETRADTVLEEAAETA
ncbi:MAG: universal stress protein, partial [Halobacteria archaeon]|nr:universal stress protein [Halobacteria archaeon]